MIDKRNMKKTRDSLAVLDSMAIDSRGVQREMVSWCIFDTQVYYSGVTRYLEFFTTQPHSRCWSNAFYYPGLLPSDISFLIDSIRLFGITSEINLGAFEFYHGQKSYGSWPAWSLGIREKNFERVPLLIQPHFPFSARIYWDGPTILGRGISGRPLASQPIQVLLRGRLFRPVQ